MPAIEDYITAIKTPALIKSQDLNGGHYVALPNGSPRRYSGGFCVVFPFETSRRKVAVRCWHSSLNSMKERTKIVSDYLSRCMLPYFVGFLYDDVGVVVNGEVMPIVIMDWAEGKTLKDYIHENLYDKQCLLNLADEFLNMTNVLHEHHISHGDLQHGNILVDANGEIILVDYDSVFVPGLEGWECEIPGIPGYQHPSRFSGKQIMSEKADFFSELIIYTSIRGIAEMPELWDELMLEDTDTLLFTADDIESRGGSMIFHRLRRVEGLQPMVDAVAKALSQSSFESLSPLSEAVKDPVEVMSEKWKDNGFAPNKPDYTSNLSDLSGQWENNGFTPNKPDYTKGVKDIKW